LANEHLAQLKAGQPVRIPRFFADMNHTERIKPAPFLFIEGLLALQNPPIREKANLKIFLDSSPATRAKRYYDRIQNKERNTYGSEIDAKRLDLVESCYETYIAPSRDHADIVLNAEKEKNQIHQALMQLSRILTKHHYPHFKDQ
jgi:uridine kinase